MTSSWRDHYVIITSTLRINSGFNDGNRKSILDNLPLVGMYRAHYFNNCVLHSNNFNNSTNERKSDTGFVSKFLGNSRLHFRKKFLKPTSDWKGKCWQTTTIVAFDQDIELVFSFQLRFGWRNELLGIIEIIIFKMLPSSKKCAMGLWWFSSLLESFPSHLKIAMHSKRLLHLSYFLGIVLPEFYTIYYTRYYTKLYRTIKIYWRTVEVQFWILCCIQWWARNSARQPK